jgi:hypothetical protein
MDIETTWWEKTDKPHVWRGNIGSPVYRCLSTGEERDTTELPIGALTWYDDGAAYKGPDGHSIMCKLPDGKTWYIDSRATNCTMPNDSVHRCWVRHGTIGDRLTVDKNGNTCAAGAGSIATDKYHGFLRDGKLVNA